MSSNSRTHSGAEVEVNDGNLHCSLTFSTTQDRYAIQGLRRLLYSLRV